jgi:hypothetical protein
MFDVDTCVPRSSEYYVASKWCIAERFTAFLVVDLGDGNSNAVDNDDEDDSDDNDDDDDSDDNDDDDDSDDDKTLQFLWTCAGNGSGSGAEVQPSTLNPKNPKPLKP